VHILRTGHTMESACETLCSFLKKSRDRRPTALFAMNDVAAVGGMRAAIECGLRVPQDLSIVGVDDIPLCSYLPISLTSIRQRYRAITRSAMELLNSRIEAEENLPPRQIIHPTVFVRRESVAPVSP
jgi:LacI family transcriptional regulator